MGSERIVADAVIETLLAWGVRRVFICPGSTEAGFLDASQRHPDLEIVLTTHESVAVAMADGYARATGEPAVVYLHTHLGLANGLAHLDAARLARSPVVVLTGLKPRSLQAHDGFTTLPGTGALAAPFVKRHWQSLAGDEVADDLARCLRSAVMEPCGPTWLGVGQDLLEAECRTPAAGPERFRVDASPAPDPLLLDQAARLLADARHPVVVAGAETARHEAAEAVLGLVGRLGGAVFHEDRRSFERSVVPTGHPQYAGLYDPEHPHAAEADAVLLLGCRSFMEFEPFTRPPLPPTVKVVHTHIDPAEIGRTHRVDVAVIGDERRVALGLLERLPTRPGSTGADDAAGVISARPAPAGSRAGDGTAREGAAQEGTATVEEVVDALAQVVDAGTTVIEDATTSEAALLTGLPQFSPESMLTSVSGSLGWGMGAALGFQLAAPERTVIAVLGDGVFQFGPQALWAAARYRIPVLFVVINNRSYAAVAAAMVRHRKRTGLPVGEVAEYPGKDISGVDIAAVAAGFGLPARRLTRAAEIPAAVRDLRRAGGPALIEILTDPDDLGGRPR
ncbi:MAG TPA: thiamine pyrophosphate-binding protein [Trebonia sp.]